MSKRGWPQCTSVRALVMRTMPKQVQYCTFCLTKAPRYHASGHTTPSKPFKRRYRRLGEENKAPETEGYVLGSSRVFPSSCKEHTLKDYACSACKTVYQECRFLNFALSDITTISNCRHHDLADEHQFLLVLLTVYEGWLSSPPFPGGRQAGYL